MAGPATREDFDRAQIIAGVVRLVVIVLIFAAAFAVSPWGPLG